MRVHHFVMAELVSWAAAAVVLSTFFLPGCTDTEVRDAGSGGAVEAPGLSGRIAVRLFDDEDNVYDYDVFTKGGIIRVTERADETALRAALFLNRAGPGQDILANPQGTYGLGIPSYYAIGPLVDLANGEEFPLPGDERYKWPFAWSPNGRYLAAAVDETNAIVSYTVAVIDIERRAVALVRRFEETYIVDVAWSPASDRLAVLVADEHTGLGPLELLSAAAGHPVPYLSFSLRVLDRAGGEVLVEAVVKDRVRYGRGRVAWISVPPQ